MVVIAIALLQQHQYWVFPWVDTEYIWQIAEREKNWNAENHLEIDVRYCLQWPWLLQRGYPLNGMALEIDWFKDGLISTSRSIVISQY